MTTRLLLVVALLLAAGWAPPTHAQRIVVSGVPQEVSVTSLPAVTFASPQAGTQSGTWTVQPGNTANTTPWLVTANIGTYTAVTGNAPAAASVGVAAAQCLAANASRTFAVFINTSTATISLAESGQTAVLNSGITLEPGAVYNMVPPFVTTGAVSCIASAAASNLSTLEKQ